MERPIVGIFAEAADEMEYIRPAIETHFSEDVPELVVQGGDLSRSEVIETADVLLTFNFDEGDLEHLGNIDWIQALSAGIDSYPLDELAERSILLTNASGVHGEPVGQQVLGYLLIFERRIHEGIAQQRSGDWDPYLGGELGDRTLGIVGVGAIGSRIAELGAAFGMTVIGSKRDPSDAPAVLDECVAADDLHRLLESTNYLVIACPLTEETRGMIGADELELLPENAVVVNIARGEIVHEEALIDALDAETIRGAALDVFEEEPLPESSPLRDMDDVIMTPHMAGSSPHYFDRAIEIFAENYGSYVSGDREAMQNRIL